MQAGSTFLFRVGADTHLWMILSDPKEDSENVILVNFTTLTDEKEAVCVVDVGDHPWVTHRTCVNYRKSMNVSLKQLQEADARRLLEHHADLSPALLHRIRNSAANSRGFKPAHYEVLLEQDLIEFDDLE